MPDTKYRCRLHGATMAGHAEHGVEWCESTVESTAVDTTTSDAPAMPADPIGTIPTDVLAGMARRAYATAARSWAEYRAADRPARGILRDAAESDDAYFRRLTAELGRRIAAESADATYRAAEWRAENGGRA